jgi:hypothetical protein
LHFNVVENDYFCIVDCTIDLFDPAYLTL